MRYLSYFILICLFLVSCTFNANISGLSTVDPNTGNVNTPAPSNINQVKDYFPILTNTSADVGSAFQGKTTDSGDPIVAINITTQPNHGTVTVSGTTITYVPTLGYKGKDSFSYLANGQNGSKSSGTIRLEVRDMHTWIGAGQDAKWSNPDNWIGGLPAVSDTVTFDDACLVCDVIVDGNQAIDGVLIDPSFTGSINLDNTTPLASTLSIGTVGLTMGAGTLNLGKGKISIASDALFTAGTINGQSGNLVMSKNVTLSSGMSINAGNSTFEFNGSSGGTINTGSFNLANVSFTHDSSGKTITGNMNVQKRLYFNVLYDSIYTGNIIASGDIQVDSLSSGSGTAKIKIAGNGNQLVSGTSNGALPNLEIASTGGVVTFKDIVRIRKDFTYTSGNVQFNDPAYGASTIDFTGSSTAGTITVPSTLQFANVQFTHDSSSKTLSGTLSVYGTLLFNVTFVSITGGVIEAYNDIAITKMSSSGSAMNLRLVGSNNQLITGTANGVVPNFEIAKTGGVAVVNGTLTVSKNFTYTSGNIDFNNVTYGISTVILTGANTGGTITVPSTLAFGNVQFTHDSTGKTLSGTMSVYGDLTFNVTFVSLTGGQIDAYKNVNLTKLSSGGTFVLSLKGSNNQLITATTNANLGHFDISKTGGTAIVSGSLGVSRNFTYTSGSIDFNNITYGKATTRFVGSNTGGTITPGSVAFGDVIFSHDSTSKALSGTMSVKGNLTVSTIFVWLNGGTIQVEGNLSVTQTGGSANASGKAQIVLTGSNAQSISHVTTYAFPGQKLTISKSGGNVSLATNLNLNNTQSLDVTTSASVLLGGFNLDGNGTFSCFGGTVTKGGGALWTSGTTSNTGCTIN